MRHLAGLLVIALAMASSACSGGTDESVPARDTSALTAAELGWIRAYSALTIDIYDEDGHVGVDDCRSSLERMGPPPTERLQPVADLVPSVCANLEQPGMRRRALDLINQADDLARPYLLDQQPLPLRVGITADSRADVILSEVASEVADRPVEVRCWSERDWERVVGEDDAWNDDQSDPDELVGWSDDVFDRIHIVLDMCNTITHVDGNGLGTSRRGRVDAVDAIESLAHEIQHFVLPEADEATVECAAIRSLPKLARRFGVSPADARQLAELYRTVIYPDLGDEYTKGGCPRDG